MVWYCLELKKTPAGKSNFNDRACPFGHARFHDGAIMCTQTLHGIAIRMIKKKVM